MIIDALFFSVPGVLFCARERLDLWRYQIPNANNIGNLLAVGGVPGSIQAKNEASDHKPTPGDMRYAAALSG
jgi:hypothetical protein